VQEEVKPNDAVPFDTAEKSTIAIVNGKVANADEVLECDVLIKDGIITVVGKDLDIPSEAQIIDAREKFVIPGAIDYDTRLTGCGSAGMLTQQTLADRSKAIVRSGTTTVVSLLPTSDMDKTSDFINNLRNTSDSNTNELYCHLGLKLLCDNAAADMTDATVQRLGVATFQLPAEQVFAMDDEELLTLLKSIRECGGVLNIDVRQGALDNSILNGNSILTPAEDLEEAVIRKICTLALLVDVPVCFLNVGSECCVDVLADYRAKGLTVFGEVLASGLENLAKLPWNKDCLIMSSHQTKLHTEQMVEEMDNPVEEEENKENEEGDSEEDWLSVLYHHLVDKQVFDIRKLVELTSSNPAKLMNQFPARGCVREGSRADLAILHPMKSQTVSSKSATVFQLAKDSDIVGVVDTVIVDGKLVVTEGQLRPMAAWGGFLAQVPNTTVVEKAFRQETRVPLQRIDRPQDNVQSPKDGRRAWDKQRKCVSQGEIFDKELGIYQRPLSAHGVRNQQDSTFTVKTFF